ncbi:hypothetical protein C8J27_10127 [Rhodobacter aestuarii]|uniref:Uncharacterized protein n=1 Tax=Rhodobacter aestuarii TaxID=453582 RepID=A0A1N7JCY0_9RHOB|nr:MULTISPECIES: hypothetical protein [Rhodobacter]PTV96919.1 hypothetical protein C8J27_10127 [Rhodobacter aestuarii]SIS47178.1 hypothetical protein SAMN05421580_101615 [Rhodobacter aestuarii]SOB98046.1 hypothetical protein SAMN05877809_10286 [Rhodobacter sp. JA431]
MKQLLAALPLLLPLQAQAAPQVQELSCAFTQECIDLQACHDTGAVIQLIYNPGTDTAMIPADPTMVPPDPFTVAVQEETDSFNAVPLTGGKLRGPMQGFIAFNNDAVQRLLTIAPDGTARYSVHKPLEAIAFYYQGTCEEVK